MSRLPRYAENGTYRIFFPYIFLYFYLNSTNLLSLEFGLNKRS